MQRFTGAGWGLTVPFCRHFSESSGLDARAAEGVLYVTTPVDPTPFSGYKAIKTAEWIQAVSDDAKRSAIKSVTSLADGAEDPSETYPADTETATLGWIEKWSDLSDTEIQGLLRTLPKMVDNLKEDTLRLKQQGNFHHALNNNWRNELKAFASTVRDIEDDGARQLVRREGSEGHDAAVLQRVQEAKIEMVRVWSHRYIIPGGPKLSPEGIRTPATAFPAKKTTDADTDEVVEESADDDLTLL